MIIHCRNCGRSLCEIDLAEFKPIESRAVKRVLGTLGLDLPQLDTLLNPTPEGLASAFGTRCLDECRR
jgi:hypothetical protein